MKTVCAKNQWDNLSFNYNVHFNYFIRIIGRKIFDLPEYYMGAVFLMMTPAKGDGDLSKNTKKITDVYHSEIQLQYIRTKNRMLNVKN